MYDTFEGHFHNKVARKKRSTVRQILLVLLTCLTLACGEQGRREVTFLLSVSPKINKTDKTNEKIIEALSAFLRTKDESLVDNKYWMPTDFQKYKYPYLDIHNIEASKYGPNFFRPTLMEIIPTENPRQKIVKIAFIGHNLETDENQLKLICNVMAHVHMDQVLFSTYLDFSTQKWKTEERGSLIYKISPGRSINEADVARQQRDIEQICHLFQCEPIPITYYSCVDPKQLFEIKGFDYHPMMYVDKTGGLAEHGNIIFSGNNADIYTHEIVHIYTKSLFPNINVFLDEGMATYMGGSGKFTYEWHREKFDHFLSGNEGFDFREHLDPYERLYFEGETPIPYLIAALILERTNRLYGDRKTIELLNSDLEIWEILNLVGLGRDNFNEELRKELKLPTKSIWNHSH